MIEWLNANAGAIQAGSGLVIVVLTAVLVWVTKRYAETTDLYAETAKRQYDEMVAAREAGVRPYIQVLDVDFGFGIAGWPPAYVKVTLVNRDLVINHHATCK